MTPEYLKTILRYEPDTGKLYWLERDKSHGKRFRWFNSNHAGKEALTAKKPCGHTHGLINRKSYMAHRVAWALYYGEWPSDYIDHINGDPADNRISNLRVVDARDNAKNRRPNEGKASKLPHGVSQKGNGRYFAQIQVDGKNNHLGYFDTPEEASAAYRKAKGDFGFHSNHGRTSPKEQQP